MSDISYGGEQFAQQHQDNLRDILDMINFIEEPKILEIGCWTGQSTQVLATFAKMKGGTVDVVDTFRGTPGTHLIELAESRNVFELFVNNMRSKDLLDVVKVCVNDSKYAHQGFPTQHYDFIFIDGDHRYSGLISDLKNYFPKLKLTGLICGHDYEGPEYDEEFVEIDCHKERHHGVSKAVHEYFGDEIEKQFVFWIHNRMNWG